jgi:hypothetical protein
MDKEYLESLVEQGLSTRDIAKKENKSQTSVRHWLKKYSLKTKNKSFKDGYTNKSNTPKLTKENQNCSCCNVKLVEENSYYKRHKNLYYSMCKDCHANYTFKKRFNFKIKALDYKGNSCKSCGYNKDITALEFHHKNPTEKEILPAKLYYKPWDYAKQELDKCIVLCCNCHREEHYRIHQKNKLEKEFSVNLTSSFSNSILTGKNTGQKSCRNCDIVLTDDNRAAGSHSGLCKPCDSKIVIEKNINGKKRAVEYMGGCCSVCDYDKCIIAIEFHHLDPSKKSETYSKRFTSWGFDRQKKELENCIIVCSNCHREIHSKEEHKTP